MHRERPARAAVIGPSDLFPVSHSAGPRMKVKLICSFAHFARDCTVHSGETTGHRLPNLEHRTAAETLVLSVGWKERTCAVHAVVSLTCVPISVTAGSPAKIGAHCPNLGHRMNPLHHLDRVPMRTRVSIPFLPANPTLPFVAPGLRIRYDRWAPWRSDDEFDLRTQCFGTSH
jgi:hypothetical protein